MPKKLLLSIHDVTPRHFDRLREIDAFVTARVGDAYAMLVVPDFWHQWPLESHPEFCAWLRTRAEAGVEMILHGLYHRDEKRHDSAFARLQAGVMTAGEGEFLGLDAAEARSRIAAGREIVERVIGRKVSGFIAPAWLYGAGANTAVREAGFAFAEDHWRVWAPENARALTTGPVISYASRSAWRTASSLVWSRVATAVLAPRQVVRLAIHPHDFDKRVLIDEIDRALAALLAGRRPTRYAELVAR